jgi:energy-coupling factor transport system ATP-binding protein
VARIAGEGRTVICVSHDMHFVADTFERVIVMRGGTVLLEGPPDEVFAEKHWRALKSTNLGPPLAAQMGHKLGLGTTPTEESLVAALRG